MIAGFLFVYSIMAYGIANMLVYFNGPFNIITKFRDWVTSKHETLNELFSCMFCLPTNVGIILSILSLVIGSTPFTPFTILYFHDYGLWPLIIAFDGMFTGGIVYLIHTIQEFLEKRTPNV